MYFNKHKVAKVLKNVLNRNKIHKSCEIKAFYKKRI